VNWLEAGAVQPIQD
jgi:C1A family cysteine protease